MTYWELAGFETVWEWRFWFAVKNLGFYGGIILSLVFFVYLAGEFDTSRSFKEVLKDLFR